MLAAIAKRLILWAVRRDGDPVRVVTFEGTPLFRRYMPFRRDEWWNAARGAWVNRLPWWLPVNAFVHRWTNSERADFHDHPRWSITVCLRGRIIEHTPWSTRELRPGSVVFRSRKFIHAFELPPGSAGKTWTLFIVGRRKHAQNSYVVTRKGLV